MRDDLWEPKEEAARRWPGIVVVALVLLLLVGIGAGFVVTRGSSGDRVGSVVSGQEDRSAPDSSAEVDPAEITDVLPADSIPSIDDPRFTSIEGTDDLVDNEPVIVLSVGDDSRAYPLAIMTWHEIVNDEIGGRPVAVTFCPLCNTAVAFVRPKIEGEETTFGTSGKLLHSNLLMYDRTSESLWAQATGVAVQGPRTGEELERVPAQIVSWADFKSTFPAGTVLSRDTGFDRSYGDNPYPGYDDVDSEPFLFSGEVDGRLAAVERVLGVQVGRALVAYPYFRLAESSEDGATVVNDRVGDMPVVVMWKSGTASALDQTDISGSRDVGAAVAFSRRLGGEEIEFEVVDGKIRDQGTGSEWNLFGHATAGPLEGKALRAVQILDSFWFDWAAFHPDTMIWSGG